MEIVEIRDLLIPYVSQEVLTDSLLDNISIYINILLKWNATTNLTAVRDSQGIVRRHFGESLFAASKILDQGSSMNCIDVGSGAGFPGLPLKIYAPEIDLTLVESKNKKVAFLREVIRALNLTSASVHWGRAEQLSKKAELVTFRAVEKFDEILPIARSLVGPGGRIGLLVGEQQVASIEPAIGGKVETHAIPESEYRVLAIWSE